MCHWWLRSTRLTNRVRTLSAYAVSWSLKKLFLKSTAAIHLSLRCLPRRVKASMTCSSRCCCRRRFLNCVPLSTPWPRVWWLRLVSTKGAARLRLCWFSPVRFALVTWCWRVTRMAAFEPCWTRTVSPLSLQAPLSPWRFKVWLTCRQRATTSWSCSTSDVPARSRHIVKANSERPNWLSSKPPSWRTCSAKSVLAKSRHCRSSSKRTYKARKKRWRHRYSSCLTTKSRYRLLWLVWVVSAKVIST